MIIGKTIAEREEEGRIKRLEEYRAKQKKLLRKCKIIRKFAIFPVEIGNGKSAWLQFVYRVPRISPNISLWQIHGDLGLEDYDGFQEPKWFVTREEAEETPQYKRWKYVGIIKDETKELIKQKDSIVQSMH